MIKGKPCNTHAPNIMHCCTAPDCRTVRASSCHAVCRDYVFQQHPSGAIWLVCFLPRFVHLSYTFLRSFSDARSSWEAVAEVLVRCTATLRHAVTYSCVRLGVGADNFGWRSVLLKTRARARTLSLVLLSQRIQCSAVASAAHIRSS